jgi:hypothetical protein
MGVCGDFPQILAGEKGFSQIHADKGADFYGLGENSFSCGCMPE